VAEQLTVWVKLSERALRLLRRAPASTLEKIRKGLR
jgi:hypothetical protein